MFDKIFVKNYDKIVFIPFHQKFESNYYAVKPLKKRKNISKWLVAKIINPVILRSSHLSLTSNCAKGIKEEFISYYNKLIIANLSDEEIFRHLILNLDKLK